MAVIAATTLVLKPGAYEAFLEGHQTSKALLERCGAKNVRLMGTISGPEGAPALASSFEFDDYASYGRFMDALVADPEGVAALQSAGTDESPIASYQSSVWSVIDG